MLNDGDLWPITCTRCGHVFSEQIGRLHEVEILSCGKCGCRLRFKNEQFRQVTENLRRTIEIVARNVWLTEVLK